MTLCNLLLVDNKPSCVDAILQTNCKIYNNAMYIKNFLLTDHSKSEMYKIF
jgi:hypothetical protein